MEPILDNGDSKSQRKVCMFTKTKVSVISKLGAPIPSKAREDDDNVGWDVYAPHDIYLGPNEITVIDTGLILKLEYEEEDPIRPFYMVLPRSSYSKKMLRIANTVGLIDRNYCGPNDTLKITLERRKAYRIVGPDRTHVRYESLDEDNPVFRKGDAMAQLVFMYENPVSLTLTDAILSSADRGGFGSTDKL